MITQSKRRQLWVLYVLLECAPLAVSSSKLLAPWEEYWGPVTRSTFQRDIRDLRRMGCDIVADRGGYRLINPDDVGAGYEAWSNANQMLTRLDRDDGLVEVTHDQLALF